MTDVHITGEPERRPGRLRRFLRWIRDHDSDRAREYYSIAGIWSSRVYAVILPMLVLLVAMIQPAPGIQFWIAMWWGLISRMYLWYQARAILAFRAIEEQHANRDQINSFMPFISAVILIVLWAVVQVLYYSEISTKSVDFTHLGWYFIVIAMFDAVYDMRINNRVMIVLAGIPPRVEYSPPRQPHD